MGGDGGADVMPREYPRKRPRVATFDEATLRRVRQAILDGLSEADFQLRFGVEMPSAKRYLGLKGFRFEGERPAS